MRRILLITFLISLSGCWTNDIIQEPINIPDVDYPDAFIEWNDLFNQKEENYFVYVFSYTCYYCKEIKDKIISFYEQSKYTMFFCEYSKEIPIGQNITNTIESNDINSMFIKGTPSLILISEGTVLLNVAGKSDVEAIINLYSKI